MQKDLAAYVKGPRLIEISFFNLIAAKKKGVCSLKQTPFEKVGDLNLEN
jgi:hypothetical protein